MPALVIICGPPASGKSILARALGKQLSLPVISKDLVKEALMDHLGGAPAVGAATFSVQFAVARQLLEAGVGLILEGAFFREQTEIAELAPLGNTVVVNVSCALDVLERRYVQRHPTRHPGHRGPEALSDLRRRVVNGEYGIPDVSGPTLLVDTTSDFSPSVSEVVRWVRQHLDAVTGGVRIKPDELDLRLAWEQNATAWTDWARKPDHDSYWRFGRAAFFDLLPLPGRLTVDVGCGEGRVSRDLTGLGHRVVSIDASMTMVRAAVAANPSIPVALADGASLPLIEGCCDLVIAYMSLQDMSDLSSAVKEAARALVPGGQFCIAVVHPINSAGQFTGVEADADFVIRGSYLESHPYVDRIERDGMVMTFSSLHHPLEEYFQALERAGLLVEAVREIPADEASAQDLPRRQRWRRLPLFLAIRASKPHQ
jgi:SAM-dependent methyltransferase/predicted kinase